MEKLISFMIGIRVLCAYELPEIVTSRIEEIKESIANFPYSEYSIAKVQAFGYTGAFYIDTIEDYIKGELMRGNAWEPHLSLIITHHARPGTIALDIGSHIGTHTLTLANAVGPQGKVLAFEPQAKIFRELVKNLELNGINNVTCYWAAVGSELGQIEIPYLTFWNEGGTALVEGQLHEGTWTSKVIGGTGIIVDLLPIDSLDLNNVSFIKMDVEQMENAVLEGAKRTILRNKPVILLEIKGGYCEETAPPEIQEEIRFTRKKVEDMGYTIYSLGGWDYLAIPL